MAALHSASQMVALQVQCSQARLLVATMAPLVCCLALWVNGDPALTATVGRHPRSLTGLRLVAAFPADLVLIEQVCHHFMDDKWVLHTLVESLLFIRLAVADQPDCHVFEERHERRVLSLRLFWVGVLGNDIAVVDTGGEEVEEDSSPPLLRPMMEHVVPHHLIHQVDSFHVLLVGLEHGRHRNSFSLSTCSSSRHKAHLLWGVVVRQGKYRLGVDPDAVRDVIILCRAELVASQLDVLGEQCRR